MRVNELYVYPVKGLRGIPLQTATIGPQGIRHDRCFMLMTSHRSKAGFTKMQLAGFPECALFSQELDGDSVVVQYHPPPEVAEVARVAETAGSDKTRSHTTMSPTAPPPLRIPLDPAVAELSCWAADLHGSPFTGCRMGDKYDAWFSACFGFDVLLVYIGNGRRPVLGETLKPIKSSSTRTSTSSSTSSMSKLGNRLIGSRVNSMLRTGAQHFPAWLLPILLPGSWLALLFGSWLALLAYVAAVAGVLGTRLKGSKQRAEDRQRTGMDTAGSDPWLTFTDCAPLLVASEASRKNVSARLSAGVTVPMYKFRPNVVVDGEAEWSEDFWAELRVVAAVADSNKTVEGVEGEAGKDDNAEKGDKNGNEKENENKDFRLLLTSNCARCTSLNVDYSTGAPAAGELGEVLKRMAKDRRVDTGIKYSPVFGRYAFLDGSSEVRISVGDVVDVTRRNKEHTVWDWPSL